jgi:hypothetical protein
MVRPRGFEPPTFASGGRRSIQLSYGRMTCCVAIILCAMQSEPEQIGVRILKEIPQDSSA